jgi:hypothetical protein
MARLWIFSIFLSLVACSPGGKTMPQKYDLSTPQNSWQALLSAMKSGSPEAVRGVTTEQGYRDLIKRIPESEIGKDLVIFGGSWSRMETRWKKMTPAEAEASVGPEVKEHGFRFVRTDAGWKLDASMPGQ